MTWYYIILLLLYYIFIRSYILYDIRYIYIYIYLYYSCKIEYFVEVEASCFVPPQTTNFDKSDVEDTNTGWPGKCEGLKEAWHQEFDHERLKGCKMLQAFSLSFFHFEVSTGCEISPSFFRSSYLTKRPAKVGVKRKLRALFGRHEKHSLMGFHTKFWR